MLCRIKQPPITSQSDYVGSYCGPSTGDVKEKAGLGEWQGVLEVFQVTPAINIRQGVTQILAFGLAEEAIARESPLLLHRFRSDSRGGPDA